jgi:hypothetical protein
MKLLEIFSVDFHLTDQLLIRFLALVKLEQKWEYNETAYEKAYDSVRKEVVDNIRIEFGVPMKTVRVNE